MIERTMKLRAVLDVEVPEQVGLALLQESDDPLITRKFSQPVYLTDEGRPGGSMNAKWTYYVEAPFVWTQTEEEEK